MTDREEPPISDIKMGHEMSYVSFRELIKQLTGSPFEEVYKDYLLNEAKDE